MKYPMDHKVKRPFVWTKPEAADVGKTFERERKRLAKLAELQAHFSKVTPIRKEGKA